MDGIGKLVTVVVALTVVETTPTRVDYRKTVIKAGYGVNFDMVDHVVVDGGTTFYSHTWALPWPRIRTTLMPGFLCDDHEAWTARCRAIRNVVTRANHFAYDVLSRSARLLESAKRLVPPVTNETIVSSDRRRRRRRDVAEVPDWLKDSSSSSSSLADFLPTNVLGTMWSDLTNTPGRKDVEKLKSRLRSVGQAEYANSAAIRQFDADIDTMASLTSRRIDDLASRATAANDRLKRVARSIVLLREEFRDRLSQMAGKLNFSHAVDSLVLSSILPSVSNFTRACMAAEIQTGLWIAGLTTLTRGYLSPLLVAEKEIARVLEHVSQRVLTRPGYTSLRLISREPNYYYRLKDVWYAHVYDPPVDADDENRTTSDGGTTLYVTMKIPLYRVGGTFSVYRIDAYPVPVATGTARRDPSRTSGYSIVKGLPGFIAVSPNQENYVEMDTAFFLSCSGTPDVKTCGPGMSALKKRRGYQISCAFALFIEDASAIAKRCDFRYEGTDRWRPHGSAVQLTADSTFLVHASQRGPESDKWSMSCPRSKTNPQSPVEPCDMCRIDVPCFCSLSGSDFYLPERNTGCTIPDDGAITFLHHLNTAVVRNLFPDSAMARLRSYERITERVHPPFPVPDITFRVPDNFSDYVVDVSDKYSARLIDTLERQKRDLTSYATKFDAVAAKTEDFRDQVSAKSGNIQRALDDVMGGVFGGKITRVLSLVFSPVGLLGIAFVLTAFDFFPAVVSDCRSRRRRKNIRRQMFDYVSLRKRGRYVALNDDDDDD